MDSDENARFDYRDKLGREMLPRYGGMVALERGEQGIERNCGRGAR